jgi:hypothetical protein
VERLGFRAFRRPLGADATASLRRLHDAGSAAGGAAAGMEWLLAGILQSPDFLYQLATPIAATGPTLALDDFTMASRLAFFLWASPPDPALLDAAGQGGLRATAALEAQVQRMLADPRAARMRGDYHASWLELGRLDGVTRDAPEFTPALAAALRRSVLAGIDDLYRNGARVDALLGSSTVFADALVAKTYGLALPAGADPAAFTAVSASPAQRHGLVSHPALMALLASADSSDPIRRGVFVTEALLCQSLPDPAPDIPNLPAPRRGLSTRQRLEQHRAAPACAACHRLFDPIGLALEGYDSIGRFRDSDQGVPVDSSGDVQSGTDVDGPFANGAELLARLGGSAAVRDCMVDRWLAYALRREPVAGETCAVAAIKTRFRADGDLAALLAAIATSTSFRNVLAAEGAAP